jgi:hypothetical protein
VTPPVTTSSCSNGGAPEVESNDSAASATNIGSATAFCGSLSSASDVDNFAFTLPANAKSLSWSASYSVQGVVMSITVNGVTTPASAAPPWAPGSTYVVTVSGASAATYGVTLNIGL